MGFYLNPGNDGFWEAVRSRIYVDKTGLIAHTNELIDTEEKYVCVSRPRRFGKSMALKMLAAYYSRGCDPRGLFAGRIIEKDASFQTHLNKYDVICLNMQQFLIEAAPGKIMDYLEAEVSEELTETYGHLFPIRKEVTKHVVLVVHDRLRPAHPAPDDRIRADDVEASAKEDQLGDRLPHEAFHEEYGYMDICA